MEENINNDVEENKVWAFIAYIWVLSIAVLLAKKDSPYAHYHAKQGFLVFLISVGIMILNIPFFFLTPIFWIINVALVVLSIIGIINALNGKKEPLPLIGKFAEKLKI